MLTKKELIELKYLDALGFIYIARNEIDSLKVFKEKPVRDKVVNCRNSSGHDTWVTENNSVEEFSLCQNVKLGEYNFITWEDGILNIKDLIIPFEEIKVLCEICDGNGFIQIPDYDWEENPIADMKLSCYECDEKGYIILT